MSLVIWKRFVLCFIKLNAIIDLKHEFFDNPSVCDVCVCVNMYWDKLSEQRITNSAHCVVCDLTLTVMCRRYLESGKQVLHEWVNVLHIFVLVPLVFYFNFIHYWNSRSIQFLCVFWFLLNKHLHTHIFATHLILFQLLSIIIIILFAILFHLIWLIINIDSTGELNSVCVYLF